MVRVGVRAIAVVVVASGAAGVAKTAGDVRVGAATVMEGWTRVAVAISWTVAVGLPIGDGVTLGWGGAFTVKDMAVWVRPIDIWIATVVA